MALNPDFDYESILSFDNASANKPTVLNYVGTKELVILYRGVTNSTKEGCAEWLEINRKSITDPQISNMIYEGTWLCVEVSFDEKRGGIVQRLRVDGVIENVVSERSAGAEVLRSYYFQIVDPDAYNVPDTVATGDVYTKRVADNGNGTYDITIEKSTTANLTSSSYTRSARYSEVTVVNTNNTAQSFVVDGGVIPNPDGNVVTIQNVPLENGLFRTTVTTREETSITGTGSVDSAGYSESSTTEIYDELQEFGVNVTAAATGEIKKINNVPLDDGRYRTTITTRTAIAQRVPPLSDGSPYYIAWASDYSDAGGGSTADGGRLIIGRNQPKTQFYSDTNLVSSYFINSISVSINDYGLYDYSIRSSI